jgi:hypothetical protein
VNSALVTLIPFLTGCISRSRDSSSPDGPVPARGHNSRSPDCAGSTPEAINLWAAALAQEFSGRPVAVALEQTRGSLTGMRCKYAHIVSIPVHSTAVSSRIQPYPTIAKPSRPPALKTTCETAR